MSAPKSQDRSFRGTIVTFASAGGASQTPGSAALTVSFPSAIGWKVSPGSIVASPAGSSVQVTWAVRSRAVEVASTARSCKPASSAVIVNDLGVIATAGSAGAGGGLGGSGTTASAVRGTG